jgi:glutamate---cysteine ligase / carboxylate-amine ligase
VTAFAPSAPWSLGVEEELFLVDRSTLDTVPLVADVVAGRGPRLKPELFACIVEITTPVCVDAGEVLAELQRLRLEAAARAEPHGATFLATGTHPTARCEGQAIVQDPVYLEVAAQLGPAVYRQLVCGLHVHVGVGDAQACLRSLEGVLPWLPAVLSLSANSPFVDGAATGLRSVRAERLAELPTGGAPPVFRRWRDWELRTAGLDYRRLHWDARPHPDYGTLEVRIADQQTDARRSAALAALVQALVRTAADVDAEPCDREFYAERRARASIEPSDDRELAALAARVEPASRELGSWPLVRDLLASRPEAERQLEVGLPDVVRDLAGRSLPSRG